MAMAPGQLFDPLTFSPEQAAMLNNVPGQSLGATNTPEQLLAAQKLTANVPVDRTGSATPLGITNPPVDNTANETVAGAQDSLQKYYDLQNQPKTADQLASDKLRTDTATLLQNDTGRGAAQIAAENNQGIPELNKQLSDINGEIAKKTAQYHALNADINSRPITMGSIIGAQAQNRMLYAADIEMLQATKSALEGNISVAQASANRSVDMKYDDIEKQIDIRMKQLELLQPSLDAEEKKRANALELYLQDQKDAAAEQKAEAKKFQNLKISALGDNMPVSVAQQAQTFFDAGRVDEAYALMSPYTGSNSLDSSGAGDGTTGFKSSKIESEVRDLAVTFTDDDNLSLEDAYKKLRRLYSQSEVTDQALKDILGIAPAPSEQAGSTVTGGTTEKPKLDITQQGAFLGNLNATGREISTWWNSLF